MTDAERARLADALERTADGDAKAFQLVYRLTSSQIFGICLRVCRERKAAEDILQDVFTTVWTRAGSFDRKRGSAMAWLGTIARNRSIDWRRAHVPVPIPSSILEALPDPSISAPDMLLRDERERMLLDCMETLEERQRGAIRTAFFEGLSYAELAEQDGVPFGTIKSRIRRGLARLRECLDGADD